MMTKLADELEALAANIATGVADRCQGDRKPGAAPARYAIIWQAARLGAIGAIESMMHD